MSGVCSRVVMSADCQHQQHPKGTVPIISKIFPFFVLYIHIPVVCLRLNHCDSRSTDTGWNRDVKRLMKEGMLKGRERGNGNGRTGHHRGGCREQRGG